MIGSLVHRYLLAAPGAALSVLQQRRIKPIDWNNPIHLSPNYFGDLVKKETSRSALECIQSKVVDVSKERLFDMNIFVSEIAYELGFKYPQHFFRLFKQNRHHAE